MQDHKPAKLDALMYGIFTVTATFSAFMLPVFILALIKNFSLNSAFPHWLLFGYFFCILFSALYHSLFRIKYLSFDLKLGKAVKIIGIIINLVIILGTLALIFLLP
jgi:hypothetical protein